MPVLLEVNPIIEAGGQIAAIIICLFVFIFVLVALVFNLAMAFGLDWVREKAQLVKMLRPQVDSVNNVTERTMEGQPLRDDENPVIRTVARVPVQVRNFNREVNERTGTVASAVIEYRARMVQAQTIVKTFFGAGRQRASELEGRENVQEIKSPGYQILMDKHEEARESGTVPKRVDEGQAVTATQLQNVPRR